MSRCRGTTGGRWPWIALALLAVAPSAFAQRDARDRLPIARTPAAGFAAFVSARGVGHVAEAEAALSSLAAFPHALVRVELERVASPAHTDEEARAALTVLERMGVANDLELAPNLARPGSEAELEAAVLAIARRDTHALAVLADLSRAAPTAVRRSFLRAVEGLGSLAAVSWIARCADRAPDVRSEALARLGRLAQALPHPAPDEALTVVRAVLGGVASDSLRDAVIASGRMEDGEAIPYLIALLREEDPGLVTDAAWALHAISGLDLGRRAETWETWYAGEIAWWRDASDAAFADLEDFEPAVRTRGLLSIASRRVSRDSLSLRVIPLLEDVDPGVARIAALSLRALRSKVAAAALVNALERPEPEVGDAAWDALRAITRKDLPRDVAAWRSVCGG